MTKEVSVRARKQKRVICDLKTLGYTSTLAKRSTGRDFDTMLVILIEYTEINNCILYLLREQHKNSETQY